MAKRMPYTTARKDSQNSVFERRVPRDLLDKLRGRTFVLRFPPLKDANGTFAKGRFGTVVRFSVRSRDPDVVRARIALATAHFEAVFAAVRNGPVPLASKLIVALSGEVYRYYAQTFDEEPGSSAGWAGWKAFNRAALEGRLVDVPPLELDGGPDNGEAAREIFGADLTAGVDSLPRAESVEALERRFGKLATWVLNSHALEVAPETRRALLREIGRAAQDAGWKNKRAAQGDWTPDPAALRFPQIAELKRPTLLSLESLFEKWKSETRPAPSTIASWRGSIRRLEAHVRSKGVEAISVDDILDWKNAMLAEGLSTKTIRDGHVAAIRALFEYGKANRLVAANPTDGVKVAIRRRAGEGKLPYTDEEVGRLLALARQETNAARRWLPWLAALTGARIGEVAQLWGENIRRIDGVLALDLKPAPDEGASFKNAGSERHVPVHPALVREGFLNFVETKGNSPLFYTGRSRPGRTDASRHATKGVTNRLGAWIRENGFEDPRKAPSHALRRWFKITADRCGIPTAHSDMLQGHSVRTEGDRYRSGVSLAFLAEQITKIPVPLDD